MRTKAPTLSPMWAQGDVFILTDKSKFNAQSNILSREPGFERLLLLARQSTLLGQPMYLKLQEPCENVSVLLDAIYKRPLFSKPLSKATFVETLISLRNMALKYDCPGVIEEVMEIIKARLPTTYEGLEAIDLYSPIVLFQGDAFRLATFIETDLKSLKNRLPLAWYLCLGELQRNGNIRPELERVLWSAKRQLGADALTHTFKWLSEHEDATIPVVGRCKNTASCNEARRRLFISLWGVHPGLNRALQPWDNTWNAHFCVACRTAAREVHDEGRRKIWKKLPRYFNLAGWDS